MAKHRYITRDPTRYDGGDLSAEARALLALKRELLREDRRAEAWRRHREQDNLRRRSGLNDRPAAARVETPQYEPLALVRARDAKDQKRAREGGGDEYVARTQRAAQPAGLAGGPVRTQAIWAVLGPTPQCAPGDVMAARQFHARICRALEDEACPWTRDERSHLYVLEKRWRQRMNGEDARFLVYGNRGGRLPKEAELQVARLRGRDV